MSNSYRKRYLYGEKITAEEMIDANELELCKEQQNYQTPYEEDAQTAPPEPQTTNHEPSDEPKNMSVITALCTILSAVCLAAALGVTAYFVFF